MQVTRFCWQLPLCGKWKLNFDRFIFCVLNNSGVDAILRYESGAVIMVASHKEEGLYMVVDIEALTALRRLQLILFKDISDLILERDSLLINDATNSHQ